MFPFDDTLKGHLEITNIKTGQLPFPIFTFPKGSFFVDRTYAINKVTGKILRPGIDYHVLSCNENIQYNIDTSLNNKLKNSYVRNAILLRTTEDLDLDWYVYYAGGEDSTKPAEYANYINSLFNIAQSNATTNQYTTKHQGWGSYLSHDNTQIMAGKFINSHHFQQEEERIQGGFNGLGWGKVEQALSYLADTITSGNDPLIIQAFYNWIQHNDIEFLKVKNSRNDELTTGINNLDRKRVDLEQFVYSDSGISSPNHKMIKHNHVVLRGIDPNNRTPATTDPTAVLRETVGFYALAKGGHDVTTSATKLMQRKANDFIDRRQTIELSFNKKQYSQNAEAIRINMKIGRVNIDTNKVYTLYVVSRELGVISSINVTSQVQTLADTLINITYPNQPHDFNTDTIFAYVLDENLDYTNCIPTTANVIITSNMYGYKLEINNHNAFVLGNGNNVNTEVSEFGGFEAIITRDFSEGPATLNLRFKIGETNTLMRFNNNLASISVNFATNETTKRIFIRPQFETQTIPYIRAVIMYQSEEVDAVYIGVASAQKQTLANITVHTSQNDNSFNWKYGVKTEAYLKVRFSKDTLFSGSDFSLKVDNHTANAVDVTLLDGIYVDNTTMVYPLVIKGPVNSLFGLSLQSSGGYSISNRVNLAIDTVGAVSVAKQNFKDVIRGKHLTQKHIDGKWEVLFDLEFDGVIDDGVLFEITGITPNIQGFAKYAMVRDNRLMFSLKSDVFLSESLTITLKQNTVDYVVTVPASNTVLPIAFDQILYSDGTIATNTIEMDRPFKVLVTNPYSDRTLTFTLGTYSPAVMLTDITFNTHKATATNATLTPFITTVTLGPNETKQLNNDEWISITSLTSANVSALGIAGLFAPPYRIATIDVNGGVISSRDYPSIATYSVLSAIKVNSVNRVYGLPVINLDDVVNVIDVNIVGVDLNRVVKASTTHPQFTVNMVNIVSSAVNKTTTLSLEVKLNRSGELIEDGVAFVISLLDSTDTTVHIVECSLRVINDV